jgi:hypothetical protein
MNFDEIKAEFRSGDKARIEKISSKICAIKDMHILKELSVHFDEFRQLVANLPIEQNYGRDYRFSSLRAANLLGEVSRGRCLCRSFNSGNSFFPPSAEKRGEIVILERIEDEENYSTIYKFQCVKCGSKYSANVNMAGHAPFTRM